MLSMATLTIESIGMMLDSLCISAANSALCGLIIKERFTDMNMRKLPAFELYNVDKVECHNEILTFKTRRVAELVQRELGGTIRETFIHVGTI